MLVLNYPADCLYFSQGWYVDYMYMDTPKSYGEKKMKYLMKNKRNKKKESYANHRNPTPLHRVRRHYVTSYINHKKRDTEVIEEFVFPHPSAKSSNLWDCSAGRPKVY
jgi:hypothetical protein